MSGSGWDAFTGVLDALPDVQEWSGGPPGCPGVVGKPSRMFESGRESLPDVRKWSGGSHVWSGGPPRCPGVVVSPSQRSGSGR